MEHDLLIVLFPSAITTALLSFYLSEKIMLKFFAATLLAVTAVSLLQIQVFVGFGSVNPTVYTGHDATDPGTMGVVPLAVGLGLWSAIFLIDSIRLVQLWTNENRRRKQQGMAAGTLEQMAKYM